MSSERELGGYLLGRRIAVGGMAEIFEATRRDGKGGPLVLKRLLPQYAKDAEVVRMLEHEGELVRRLAHPSLVRVIDVVTEGEEPFLVLERVDGVSADVLVDAMADRKERCTLPMALALVLPLLDALAFVHEAEDDEGAPLGIVHRDVTPHNVLVSRDGEVKLGDFGIARSSMRDARTKTGVLKGKLRYLAPEQVTGSSLDARTDLYAVGALLFELLAGEPYLSAGSEVELLRAAEESRYRSLGELVSDVDPRLERILERALSRFAEQRPKRAASLRAELAALVDDAQLEEGRAAWARLVSATAPPIAIPAEAPASTSPPRRRLGGITLGGVGLGAVLVAGATAAFFMSRDEWALPLRHPSIATNVDPSRHETGATPAALEGVERAEAPHLEADGPDRASAAEPTEPRGFPAAREATRPPEPATAPRRTEIVREHGRDAPTPDPTLEPTPTPELEPVRDEVAALRAELATRGILVADLTPDQRRALSSVDAAIGRADADAARRELESLAAELRAIAVDEPFVRAKLERVDARIRAARAAGADTREVERLGALALQDLLERRPDATNRRLNEMLGRLRVR